MSLSTYTVSFFGHREIPNILALEDRLLRIIRDVINEHEYVEFLVGRNGDFDQLAASTIRQAIRKYGCGNAALILVLPYSKAEYRDNQREYHEYYDEVEICTASSQAHPKAAIQVRNKAMSSPDRSDLKKPCNRLLCVFWLCHFHLSAVLQSFWTFYHLIFFY